MRIPLLVLCTAVWGCGHDLNGACPEIDAATELDSPDVAASVSGAQGGWLTVHGDGFELLPEGLDGNAWLPTAVLELGDAEVDLEVVYRSARQMDLHLPPQDPTLTAGLWDLTITNPNGCSDTLAESVDVNLRQLDDSIVVAEVIPPFGWTEQATAVTILGAGFASTPRAWLSVGDLVYDWEIEQVAFIDSGSLTGIVPAGLPVGGPYDLIVENPGGGLNLLESAFTITADAPPNILELTPEAGETQDDTSVTILGENFDTTVQVSLFDQDGAEVQATVTTATSTQIDAVFPSSGDLSVGAWIVRATNADGTWDEHAAFVVRNPSAKLGTAGAWYESEPFQQARVGHGLAATTDALGRGFLYAIAGSDGTGALATVERAQADAFGTLGGWETLSTVLLEARAHGAFFEQGGWLYALGGENASGVLDTAERARILIDEAGAHPSFTEVVERPDSGGLAAGAWYYRVSAVMAANHADNPGGETPASAAWVTWVTEPGSAVELTWTSVPGAESYRLYRSDGPNGAAGSEHRVADGITATSLTDDGLAPGTAGFVPVGGLGTWQALPDLPTPWSHGALARATDPAGVRRAYLVGGWDGAALVADIHALDPASDTWTVAGTLATPRADNMAMVAGPNQAINLGMGSPTYLVVSEGEDGAGVTNDAVFAPVEANGLLGPWSDLNRLNGGGQARMDGSGLAAAGHMYIIGGGTGAASAESSSRQSEIQGPNLDMGSWSSASASGNLTVPRADFGLVQLRATLYATGGRTDAEAATASVEQVVF